VITDNSDVLAEAGGETETQPDGGDGGDAVSMGDQLTTEQKDRLQELIRSYDDVFTDRLGMTHLMQHTIRVTDQTPCYQPSYRIADAMREPVCDELRDMERRGIIEYDPHATWNSPLVIVKKPCGGLRLCNNFIQLNKRTVAEPYIMTNTMELLNKVAGAKYLTRLDMTKAYWQLKVDPQSQRYTSFQTPFGTYKYLRMPMGLVNGGATLQRLMDHVLRGAHQYADKLLDNILVWSDDFEIHLTRLTDVLERLRGAGLTLNCSKCVLATDTLRLFGFQVIRGKILPDDEKVKTISEWPIPKTKKQLKSFVGLVSYFRGHVANFAEIAFPLTELTGRYKPERLQWSQTHQNAFEQLKKALMSRPVLYPPDTTKDFQIMADSSQTTASAILMQESNDGDTTPRVISYASRKLLPRERNYSTIEREILSIVFAVSKFNHFIYGRRIVVKSDHRAVEHMNSLVKSSPRLARWALSLQLYNLTVEYLQGDHQLADALTRVD